MEPNITFRRSLVRRKGFFSLSIPPQLAQILGAAKTVTIQVDPSGGLLIKPVDE